MKSSSSNIYYLDWHRHPHSGHVPEGHTEQTVYLQTPEGSWKRQVWQGGERTRNATLACLLSAHCEATSNTNRRTYQS